MRVYIIYTPSKRLNIKGVYYINAMGLKVCLYYGQTHGYYNTGASTEIS